MLKRSLFPAWKFYFLIFEAIFHLSPDKYHGTGGWHETGLIDAMALFLFHDYGADIGDQIFVGGAFAEQTAQVMIVLAEEARAELAVGGKPDAGAMAAERLGDRSDEADFTGSAVVEAVLASGLAALVGNLLERPARVNAPADLRGGDYQVTCPVTVGIERHEFDKTHDDAAVAGEFGEGFDFVVVEATDQDGVHFGGCEAGLLGGVDAVHNS